MNNPNYGGGGGGGPPASPVPSTNQQQQQQQQVVRTQQQQGQQMMYNGQNPPQPVYQQQLQPPGQGYPIGPGMMIDPQLQQQQQPLHQQLQPPSPSSPPPQQQQQPPQQQQQQEQTPTHTTAAETVQQKIKGMFHPSQQHVVGPNLGFKPTAAMAQRHEDAFVSGKRPLYQFQVTKLRTWRTGYTRLLCLYDDHFSTVDPDSHQVTNTWNYPLLTDFMAVEKDQFLLQVKADKLKFQCHNVDRSMVLSALLQCRDENTSTTTTSTGVTTTMGTTFSSSSSSSDGPTVLCNRWTRHGHAVPSALKITPYGLVEIHPTSNQRLQVYRYVDIHAISLLSDDPTGIVLHFHNSRKTRLFCTTNRSRSDVVQLMRQNMDRIGLEFKMTDSCTHQQWKDKRRIEQQRKSAGPIATEWHVTKQSKRHDVSIVGSSSSSSSGYNNNNNAWPGGIVPRRLCITGTGQLLEMDSTGMVVSTKLLSDLYALVRPATAGDTICLEYVDGHTRKYFSKARDSLMVSLLDAATTLGKNPRVQVSDVPSGGYCLASFSTIGSPSEKSGGGGGGLFQPISIPLHCLKRVHTVGTAAFSYMNSSTESSTEEGGPINPIDECRNVVEICREFNASVLPTAEGLPVGEKDKLVLGAVGSLWGLVAWLLEMKVDRHLAEQAAGPLLQTLHRLSKTPAGYRNTIELATFLDCIPLLLTIDDAFTKFWAFRTLTVLVSGQPGKARDKEAEYVNKSVVFKTGGPRLVQGLVMTLLDQNASDLIRMVMSDILQSILCSFADTTSPDVFSSFIQALGENYQALLNTLYQQTPFVLENSALLLHLLSSHAPAVAGAIREAALATGILLHHFHAAVFSPMAGQRFLSRFLCSLWLSGPPECDEKKLLRRIVPRGFISYLKMPPLSREEEEQLDSIEQDAIEESIPEERDQSTLMAPGGSGQPTGASGTNTARLRSRIALARATQNAQQQQQQQPPENFRIFFHTLTQDHSLADLIWNQQTRRELRIGLESEIQYIHRETEARGMDQIAWNHQQFGIDYPSLENELRVGSVYMRLWLLAGEGFIKTWDEPLRLFELLFRRFLCEMDRNTKVTVMCIRCLERLYAVHGVEIGAFPDVMILIRSMASTRNIETQHRLLGLLATILGVRQDDAGDENRVNVPENAEQLLNLESIEQMCQFVAWGHTNGIQVGNLMTGLLKSTTPKSALLTDGSDTRPDGNSNIANTSVASFDMDCPPVWFVAATHRIPPPPETIRGPYRTSELMKLMESGEISSFTLITSAHVESYDEEEGETKTVDEALIDTGKWKRLDQIWQLRWQLCTDGSETGIYSPSEVALQALLSLTRLVDLHRSLDSRGVPYYPIPIAKRIICGLSKEPISSNGRDSVNHRLSFLSIIAQSILCNDPNVVDQAANLLFKLTRYNPEGVCKLYLTGVYFFMACYTGSNFLALAKLMHATHLMQHFKSGYAAAAEDDEIPLRERSVLGGMLPEGVLYILVNYGAEKFNDVFVGNYDTPEVIWRLDMRKHLIEMVRQHLGDFPKRLRQNTTTQYEYCPMPGVAYKRLENEIFCHKYYLSNLCDENRFPNWPISEPVEVFRATLEEFKKQMNRDESEEEEALKNATKILNLKPGDGSVDLRKAYRALARKYHPDKNPAGREMFEAIQGAYELLLPIVESGREMRFFASENNESELSADPQRTYSAEGFPGGASQMGTLQLLIKTQILICRRFENEMGKYKYPAYRFLLSCLTMSPSSQEARGSDDVNLLFRSTYLTSERSIFVKDTVELIFRTCLISPLNAEELVGENGVLILDDILDFYVHATSLLHKSPKGESELASAEILYEILSNVVHTIAGIAFYESGRSAIEALSNLPRFCINWRRCLDGKYLSSTSLKGHDVSLKKFALEGIGSMARSSILQNGLVGAGIIWPLGRFLLGFDPTLDESSISRENADDDIGLSQAACNTQGRLAARALGMLSGYLQDPKLTAPVNPDLQAAMATMLTSPVALLLRNKRTGEILRILNTNVETPSRIWNVEMRVELLKLISNLEANRPESEIQTVAEELNGLKGFSYSFLKNEMQIGGIYIRVFNKLGIEKGGLRDIVNPALFAKQLADFLARCINSSGHLPDGWIEIPISGSDQATDEASTSLDMTSITDTRFIMAISALRVLIRSDRLIDDVLCDSSTNVPSVVLSLLELPQESEAFEVGCDILSTLSSNQRFADAVAGQGALWRLLWVLERPGGPDDVSSEVESPGVSPGKMNDMLRKQRGWTLLESLSSSPSIAQMIVESSAWLELLGILVGYKDFTKVWIARVGAAKTLSRLLWDPRTGQATSPLMERFLPPSLVLILKEKGPDTMLNLFDSESDTPELIWDGTMRAELRKVTSHEIDSLMAVRRETGGGKGNFNVQPSVRVRYTKLENELFIGGVYVSRFLKEPTYNIRDPSSFLEMLLQRWSHELQLCTENEISGEEKHSTDVVLGGQDHLQSVTDAIVYLCKIRTNLCDKLSQWGYMSRCLSFLDTILSRDLLGSPLLSVMRILHVAVNRRENVESLIASGSNDRMHGIVAFTMRSVGDTSLHPDAGFMLEMLKKVFVDALGNVKDTSKPAHRDQRTSSGVRYAMAPSPAPGEGPVSRSRVTIGNPLDDPLALGSGEVQAPAPSTAAGTFYKQGTPYQMPVANASQMQSGFSSVNEGGQFSGSASRQNQNPLSQNAYQPHPMYASTEQGVSFNQLQQTFPGNQTYLGTQWQQSNTSFPGHQGQVSPGMGGVSSGRQPWQGTQLPPEVQTPHPQHSLQYDKQHQPSLRYQNHDATSSTYAQRSAIAQQRIIAQPVTQQPSSAQQQVPLPREDNMMHGQSMSSSQASYQSQPIQHNRNTFSNTGSMSSAYQQGFGSNQLQHSAQQNPSQAQQHWPNSSQIPAAQLGAQRAHYHQPSLKQVQAPPGPNDSMNLPYIQTSTHATLGQRDNLTLQHQQAQPIQSFQQGKYVESGTVVAGQQVGQSSQFQQHSGIQTHQEPSLLQQPSAAETNQFGAQTTQPYQGFQQPPESASPSYVPQTVSQPGPVTDGAGIDARTAPEPSVLAAKLVETEEGAPGCAEGRRALLQSALVCDLPSYLVESVLENPSLSRVKDPASAKVHVVELLKLLLEDPGYGMKFKLIMEKIPAWKKYMSQDHSLFITGPEQKADYFLTDGGSSDPNKLLTQG